MSSRPLTIILKGEKDLDTVYEKVFPARVVWYNIGLGLGLSSATLSAIDEECHGKSNKALRQMLEIWFDTEKPTWEKLCKCLCKVTVMKNMLAKEIEDYVIQQGAQKASATPTRTSEAQLFNTEEATQSGRKHSRESDPPAVSPKRAKVLKPGKIEGDQLLRKIGKELVVEWMDVGVALGMDFMGLNTIENNPTIQYHLKPMNMFQKWKREAGDSFTYTTLASALEEVGLVTCAQTYCYEQ